jgi:CHAD domain-containing protein
MTTSVTLVRLFDRSWAAWLDGVETCRRKPSRRVVHALRINCRRLEALLDALAYTTGASARSLRRLRRVVVEPIEALSALRDDHVHRRKIARAGHNRGLSALLENVRDRQARDKKRALRKLARIDLAKADALAHRVRSGVVQRQGAPTPHDRELLLLTAVDGAATQVRSRLARLDRNKPRSLHKLRVSIKRFRYIVEVAEEVSPSVRIASVPTLRALQRHLGVVHDADVLASRIRRFTRRRRRHLRDLRVLARRVESDRARHVRGLSRGLPVMRHALTALASRAASGSTHRAAR